MYVHFMLSQGVRVGVVLVCVMALVASTESKKEREQKRAEIANTSSDQVVSVSSDQLEKDYRANEVSADDKYRGKVLRVSGSVQEIRKDIMNDPYVVLWTTKRFNGVHARFDADQNGQLARISIGNKITVRCRGNNVVMGSPQLKDCVLD
jgi:MFS superfamily sulfate permease-like transporter